MTLLPIRKLNASDSDFAAQLRAVLAFEASEDAAIETAVREILTEVQQRGDEAVLAYSNRFDRLGRGPNGKAMAMSELEISQAELQDALAALPAVQRTALEQAAHRIRLYHERQK
ncbi:MAG: histidinol dehydrogenase, partial [Burkholderiales bacterium]|nr:histidinol dehydrogenase [Burkholderiales bacterium]